MIELTAKSAGKLNEHTAVSHHWFCGNGKDGQKHSALHRNTGDGKQIADKEDADQHSGCTADQDGCSKRI